MHALAVDKITAALSMDTKEDAAHLSRVLHQLKTSEDAIAHKYYQVI